MNYYKPVKFAPVKLSMVQVQGIFATQFKFLQNKFLCVGYIDLYMYEQNQYVCRSRATFSRCRGPIEAAHTAGMIGATVPLESSP